MIVLLERRQPGQKKFRVRMRPPNASFDIRTDVVYLVWAYATISVK
jgi:hypothetical protein